ncbi:MAG: 2'-5' RNA ligase family protein [Verrucomicrobiota bacterium]|nr:2'-5' RNA ligase family protein [Verrucomicrobiota bacterium]
MPATPEKSSLAHWLIPAEPVRSLFVSTIARLSSRFDSPVFEPHLTIYAASSSTESSKEALKAALSGWAPFRLTVREIGCSEAFTKTVFVQFEQSAALAEMSRELREASGANDEYELDPHLSLIYKRMTKEERAELAASIRLPFTEVLFDTVKAVVCPTTPIRSREDVENWRVVASQRLTG